MEYRRFGNTICARINRGEEVIEQLTALCKKESISLAKVQAIGAADKVTIGLYDVEAQKYYKTTLEGEMEITSLLGNITIKDAEPYIHLHINVSNESMSTSGGHLNECFISATCEMFIDIIDGAIGRKTDTETGLNLFDF